MNYKGLDTRKNTQACVMNVSRTAFSPTKEDEALLVRDISRDLTKFAEDRRVDMIVLRGDWADSRHGFLAKKESRIAARTSSHVAVLLSSGH